MHRRDFMHETTMTKMTRHLWRCKQAERPLNLFDNNMFSSWDSDSSDDEGVFFGSHTEHEQQYLSKLTLSTPSPAKIIHRRKRDSREFHRRKTICFPEGVKQWEGGLTVDEGSDKENISERMEEEVEQEQEPVTVTIGMEQEVEEGRSEL